jgi:hypothetical protein
MNIDFSLTPSDLARSIQSMWGLSAIKIKSIEQSCPPGTASPVFTRQGHYTAQGWTEWTQGFQYGSAILQYDATGDDWFLDLGRKRTFETMTPHLTHFGVHDHGFNNVSTYGNLLRLMNEGRIPEDDEERAYYELALKCSGAVQANRWTPLKNGKGYIYSFNGPHSLFADTIRSLRSLALAHQLGHHVMDEQDERIDFVKRLVHHADTTAAYTVYYGTGRDAYDQWGRVAHESIFNTRNGVYRCPGTQQGYSPFSTWTRGLAWIMLGFAEQLEFLESLDPQDLDPFGGLLQMEETWRDAAAASCDFYIENTPLDGIPYWDTGAPGLVHAGQYLERPSQPDNPHEPIDSSAAAIAAQGLIRLGKWLKRRDDPSGDEYYQAGLTVLRTLLSDTYLCSDPEHQGLVLHSVYHRPNGWDHIPDGKAVPFGESSMWGDYHMREVSLLVQRLAEDKPYYRFFG